MSDSAQSSWKQGRGCDRDCARREEYAEQQDGYKNAASDERDDPV